MTEFKPLDFLRTIDADDGLDVYEYALLNAAARGTDNATFKVRRSLSALGKMSKMKRQTASDLLERPHVARYFSAIERLPRRVDLWIRQEPAPLVRGTDMAAEEDEDIEHVRGADKPCTPGGQGMSVGRTPSALSTSICPPCFQCGQAACACSTEPAPEVEKKPCGCVLDGGSCPTCRGDAPTVERHPEWQRKQWRDNDLEQNEGLNEYGEPLGLDY